MSDTLILLHTAIAVIGVILLIVVARLNPVIVLLMGAIYLGLATGVGFEDTMEAVAQGFGNIMAAVGLIIGLGVLLGSLLSATGAVQKLAELVMRSFGQQRTPYALNTSIAVILPAIQFDVALVILGSLAQRIALRTGLSVAALGGALAAGLEIALLLVVPGSAVLAVAGALDVSLGIMFVYGLLVAIPTALLATFVHMWLLGRGLWNPAKDELEFREMREEGRVLEEQETGIFPPLYISVIPLVVTVLLIVLGAFAPAVGLESGVVALLGNPITALLLGCIAAYLLAQRTLASGEIENAFEEGLRTSGLILLITGVGGSLAGVIGETGIDDIIADFFSAGAFSPILLAWLVAALLRIAQGSATVASITAAGILAPIVGGLDVSAVFIALAAGSGAAFGAHVSDNSFWLFRTLMGVSTQGTFKAYSLPQALVAVISLPLIFVLSVVL